MMLVQTASKGRNNLADTFMSVARVQPEIAFTALIGLGTLYLSLTRDLPFNLPAGGSATFVGIHYLYPLIGLCVWVGLAAVGQKQNLLRTFLIAVPCYAIVLICHFNVKLWIPHINPLLWGSLYWSIGQPVRPIVDICLAIRKFVAPVIPLDSNFYMVGYILMFYVSFCFHALCTPNKFRTLFLAALFLQGFGTFAYLLMPAIGPFIYEAGVVPRATLAQDGMSAVYQANVAGGAEWLRESGATNILAGLAAMPSLHAAASFLFLIFAWKHGRVLVVPYALLVAFIMVTAVATRWHYIIDIPFGLALASFCSWAAHSITAAEARETRKETLSPAMPEREAHGAPHPTAPHSGE